MENDDVMQDDCLEKKRAILQYWALVEFFSPYILEQILDPRRHYTKIYRERPEVEKPSWLSAEPLEQDDPKNPFAHVNSYVRKIRECRHKIFTEIDKV